MGKMNDRFFRKYGIHVINIVRKDMDVSEKIDNYGDSIVLNMKDEDF